MGKHKYIETPDKLWELFQEYKKWVKSNPIQVQDYVGKDAEMVYREKERPLTMVGFECFCMEHTEITYPDLTHYFENTNNRYKRYVPIASRIKREIQSDQITGGMVMIYSQNITARLNGLVEKSEVKQIVEQPLFPDVQEDNSD